MDTLVETPWGEDSDEDEVVDAPLMKKSTKYQRKILSKKKRLIDVLALPIRAKPLFLNNDEDVVEFTLI
jgi:hypothetical protein